MRLSDWRSVAPHESSLSPKVIATLEPVLVALGAEPDPRCWIAWGDDPVARFTVLALGEAGLAVCSVRVNVPQEGPRAAGKLVRWGRVQIGELGVERQGGHTLVNFQVEGQLLRGVDDEVERVTEFALDVLAAVDGRAIPSRAAGSGRSAAKAPRRAKAAVPALPPPRQPS
jgi:hypothetical protein